MTAEPGNWPVLLLIAAAASVVFVPVSVPGAMVIVIVTVCWSLAGVELRSDWRSLTDAVRLLHLSVGAMTASTSAVLVRASLPYDDAGIVPQGALILAGPVAVLVAFALVGTAGADRRPIDPCDVIDSLTYLLLPVAFVATVTAPWFTGPLTVQLRVTAAVVVVVSTVLFGAGVVAVVGRPVVGPVQPFLALSAMSLGGLGWMAVVLMAVGEPSERIFPRALVLPAVAYAVAAMRGELSIAPAENGWREPVPSITVAAREPERWVVFAAVGTTVAFLAILEGSIITVLAITCVAALSITRLAVVSLRIASARRTIEAFDTFLEPLAHIVDERDVVDRATVAACSLLGSDEVFVEVAGRPDLSSGLEGRRGVVNAASGSAVVSRRGQVQICTSEAIPAVRLRSLTRLADVAAVALASIHNAQIEGSPPASADPMVTPSSTLAPVASASPTTTAPAIEIWLMVERGTVVAADPQASALLGYDPINSDASRLVEAGVGGEPFRNESDGRWLQARAMAGDRPETTMIVVAPDGGRLPSPRIDASSGLPNLHDFELQGTIENAVVVVFYLHDLERVRDSVGSEASDSFVRRIAVRARRTISEDRDTVWRGDGAKLIVLSPLETEAGSPPGSATRNRPQNSDTAMWVEDRRAALAAPTALGMSFIAPAISAGFTVIDAPVSAAEALQQAEMALMNARDNQPRSTMAYSTELHARMSREWRIQSFLAAGLDDLAAAGFRVHYQPIIQVSDGRVKMVEALSRWDQPELGRVSPAEFIPIAEKAGVVGRIDDFVLAQAVEDLKRFRTVVPELAIQVNMSPTGLEPARLAEVAKFVLRQLGGDDPGIIIEVTESALSNQPMGELHKAFSFLREANLGIAVDDFGTGESNFERMNRLPFTQVKLANQFVRSSDSLLMTNVVNVVHGMDMTCVVEGVETQSQYDVAVRSGADHVQGWHFAPAMAIAEALQYCQARLDRMGPDPADGAGDGGVEKGNNSGPDDWHHADVLSSADRGALATHGDGAGRRDDDR